MSRIDVVIRGAGVVVVAGVLATGAYVVGGGGDAVTANLFVVASGGSPSCVRSSSLVEYDAAVSANAVCGPGNGNVGFDALGWDNACDAANAGDIIGVKNGSYNQPIANGYLMQGNEDCAPGAGDYNPNWEEQGVAEGSLANWTRFIPADDPQAILFEPRGMILYPANYHMIWEDIDLNTGLYIGSSGVDASLRNFVLRGLSKDDRANIHGIQVIGGKNVWLHHLDYGPSNQCGKVDANTPDNFECDPGAPTFESQYSNRGTSSPGCAPTNASLCGGYFWNGGSEWVEMYVHDRSATAAFENVRIEDVINHDQQGKQDAACCVHPGCLMTWDFGDSITSAHNLVLDHYECFRSTGASVQMAASGVTIQNSVFSCQVQSLQNTGGAWDGSCAGNAFGLAQKTGSNSQTNILFRYNTFIGNGGTPLLIQTGGSFDTFSNTRVVGNLFFGNPTCGITGVTYSTNTYTNGATACESDGTATVLGAGDPIVDSSYDTSDGLYVLDGSAFDPTADGSPALTALNPTSKNTTCGCTDYTLDHDFQGDARSSTSTKPGADG